jgi:hypothetical protein
MPPRSRRARIGDVHDLVRGMPHVTVVHGSQGNPIYQVGGRSFVFFRTPGPTPPIRAPAGATPM